MKECCETCRLKLRIEKLDYSNGGCGASGQWNHEEGDAIEAWNRRAET